jgi:hypothetical protein
MTEANQAELSEAGQLRRRQILHETKAELNALHRRRRRRKRWSVAVAASGVILGGVWLSTLALSRVPRVVDRAKFERALPARSGRNGTDTLPSPRAVISRVRDVVVHSRDFADLKVEIISDQELLELLEATGQPSALARIDGVLTVVSTLKPTS